MDPWLLEEGVKLIRSIQGDSQSFGFHVALGGSVLNKGRSEHDLDVYFLPLKGVDHSTPEKLIDYLTKLWGTPRDLAKEYLEKSSGSDFAFYTTAEGTIVHRSPSSGYWYYADHHLNHPSIRGERMSATEYITGTMPTEPTRGAYQTLTISPSGTLQASLSDSPVGPAVVNEAKKEKSPKSRFSTYRHSLSFNRSGGDKIDAFIV